MSRQTFNADYLALLRAGDAATEQHFTAYFSSLIMIKARSRKWLRPFADDIRQETLLRALNTIRTEDGVKSAERLGGFVNAVCSNVIREFVRTDKRHHRVPDEAGDVSKDNAPPDPERRFISAERQDKVRRIIRDLAPRDRQVLQTLFLEERDKDEVCQQLAVGRDYLRVLLHRAKAEFRSLYLKRGDDGDRIDQPPTRDLASRRMNR